MTCTIAITIMLMGQSFPVDRTYTGRLIAINDYTYTMDFSHEAPWMNRFVLVPKSQCVKA